MKELEKLNVHMTQQPTTPKPPADKPKTPKEAHDDGEGSGNLKD